MLCVHVCVFGGVYIPICEEVEFNVGYFSQSLLHLTFWDRVSLNLEFINLIRLAGQWTPGSSCLHLLISDGVTETCYCISFCTWALGIQVQLLGFYYNPSLTEASPSSCHEHLSKGSTAFLCSALCVNTFKCLVLWETGPVCHLPTKPGKSP